MPMNRGYLNFLGLAFRAGKCVTGEENILKSLRSNKAKLLLIANDCGETTKKRLIDKCTTFEVPYMEVADRRALAQAIGKTERIAVAITDQGFATGIRKRLS